MEILSTVMKRWSLQKGFLAARIETSSPNKAQVGRPLILVS